MDTKFCSVTKSTEQNIDGEEAVVYGLKIRGYDYLPLDDLCTDKNKLKKLCRIIEKQRPEPCHLTDIIEDYLYNI